MKSQRMLSVASATVTLLLPFTAFGQDGRGFPLGEKSRIHTNLDLAVGYDSNPTRVPEPQNNPIGNQPGPQSDVKGVVRPGLDIEVPGVNAEFGLNGNLTIQQYFGTSKNQETPSKFGGDVGTRLRLGSEESVLGFELLDVVARTPTYFADLGTASADEIRFQMWSNRGLADFVVRPGGGALELRGGYSNYMEFYDGLANSQEHGAMFEAKLRFLPKTAAVLDANLGFFSPVGQSNTTDAQTRRSNPLDVEAGLQGQLTDRLSTVLKLGFADAMVWNGGFFSTQAVDNQKTLSARVQFTYALGQNGTASLGYSRQITPIVILDSYIGNNFQAKLRFNVASRLVLQGFGAFERRLYARDDRSANLFTVDTRAEYWFFDFLNATLAYSLLKQVPDANIGSAGHYLLDEYTRHEVMFFVGLRY